MSFLGPPEGAANPPSDGQRREGTGLAENVDAARGATGFWGRDSGERVSTESGGRGLRAVSLHIASPYLSCCVRPLALEDRPDGHDMMEQHSFCRGAVAPHVQATIHDGKPHEGCAQRPADTNVSRGQ